MDNYRWNNYPKPATTAEYQALIDHHVVIDLYGVGWNVPSYKLGETRVPATIRHLQRKLLHQWQRLRPDPFLVAARRVYRGIATSKAEVLGKYTFALCFENQILKGWITEKIFDCFFAGTIPILRGGT